MKKVFSFFLCLLLIFGAFPFEAYAEGDWPENVGIEAEGGILMDASTGAVLYEKNIHNAYYPASITKILTALIVIERCNLDDMVTFSHNAVYNVEAGSTSAGMDEGDVLSVRDCLYALLLKSANEVANALAEHVAGSIDDFAEIMNEKAASLGCMDSHFANPSGLNNPDHYTSAYDIALIGQAAMQNEIFMQIDSTLYYDLPVTKRNPEGARIYPGHRMLKRNTSDYYEGCLGGKTGYTSLAGNTLVTFAQRDGLKLITVILNGHQSHYRDTKALLDFGFQNFQTVNALNFDLTYASLTNDMTIAGLPVSTLSGLQLDPSGCLTLPKMGDFSSVTSQISYDLPETAPSNAIARVDYSWDGRNLGSSYLIVNTVGSDSVAVDSTTIAQIADITLPDESSLQESLAAETEDARAPFHVPSIVWVILGVLAVLAVIVGIVIAVRSYQEKKEMEARLLRRQKRLARLNDSRISSLEFDLKMEQKRRSRRSSKSRRRYRDRNNY